MPAKVLVIQYRYGAAYVYRYTLRSTLHLALTFKYRYRSSLRNLSTTLTLMHPCTPVAHRTFDLTFSGHSERTFSSGKVSDTRQNVKIPPNICLHTECTYMKTKESYVFRKKKAWQNRTLKEHSILVAAQTIKELQT